MTALLITTEEELDPVLDRLVASDRYALDTEFHRERTYWPGLALVQVAWPAGPAGPAGHALIDPFAVDAGRLSKVLAGPGAMVAHAAEQDLEIVERICGHGPSALFDTQIAAGFVGQGSASLATLTQTFLGVEVTKGDRLTDWRIRPLTDSQVAYAAADVDRLLDLADAISAELEQVGRIQWAQEECDAALARPHGPVEPERAWWKLRDARALKGSARGVAQELAAWRERRAQLTDQPVRTVLPDLAIQAIAHRPPSSVDALSQVRGMEGRRLKQALADEVLGAVKKGLTLPASEIRLPPAEDVPKDLRAPAALVMAWVAQVARRERIDTSLLATRSDVASFLRGDETSRLSHGWRSEILSEPISALIGGRASLAFDVAGELVLEDRSGRRFG